ncbi:hypothetical protein PRUPE_6G358800 [Prunus persica]|uniref:Uncharacterized protein n=1 Tax=Prunus persica TaxID=3760 RepID=A0A251P293_PRUPE|nr:hypothetical protein PRUPE_6G358800 [Prunus persica]
MCARKLHDRLVNVFTKMWTLKISVIKSSKSRSCMCTLLSYITYYVPALTTLCD